jgi:hypothetical protein
VQVFPGVLLSSESMPTGCDRTEGSPNKQVRTKCTLLPRREQKREHRANLPLQSFFIVFLFF